MKLYIVSKICFQLIRELSIVLFVDSAFFLMIASIWATWTKNLHGWVKNVQPLPRRREGDGFVNCMLRGGGGEIRRGDLIFFQPLGKGYKYRLSGCPAKLQF